MAQARIFAITGTGIPEQTYNGAVFNGSWNFTDGAGEVVDMTPPPWLPGSYVTETYNFTNPGGSSATNFTPTVFTFGDGSTISTDDMVDLGTSFGSTNNMQTVLSDGTVINGKINLAIIDASNGQRFAVLLEAGPGATDLEPYLQSGLEIVSVTGTSIHDTRYNTVADTTPCFTRGTHILTPNGDVRVEDIHVGSRVVTLDNATQTVRWIGPTMRAAKGACAPILIKAGALDNDADLWVSQQHRMLVRNAKAELLFGENEVLVPAKSLVNDDTIRIVEGGQVEYFHILFDRHEIVFAEGAMTESLHLGSQSLKSLPNESIQEIELLFPELISGVKKLRPTARQVLRNYEVRTLLGAA